MCSIYKMDSDGYWKLLFQSRLLYGWFCPVPRVGVRMLVCHQLTSRGKDVCPLPLHARLLIKISTWKSQEVVATASVRIERFATLSLSQNSNFHMYFSSYSFHSTKVSTSLFNNTILCFSLVYSLFGDGEGRGYTVHLSYDICQSHHQESAARMPQIFDHRSMLVSHTTRNLRHVCRRFSIIDQCLSVTPPGICGTFAADFRS
jgi:hypothetical protein